MGVGDDPSDVNMPAPEVAHRAARRARPGRVQFTSQDLDDLARQMGIDAASAIGPNVTAIRALIEQARIVSAMIEPDAVAAAEEHGALALIVHAQGGQVFQRELVAIAPGDKVLPLADAIEALKAAAR